MVKSDLPFGSEFSPSQVDILRVLKIAKNSKGDWKLFENSIRKEYYENNKTSDYNKNKLANNCKLSMIAYDLIDRNSNLTATGIELLKLEKDPDELYDKFAKHIILNKMGYALIQCIQDMHSAGEKIDLIKLREWLKERGIEFPRGGKHPSIMRLWLEKAGVFEKNSYIVNEVNLNRIIGSSENEIEVLALLTLEQKAFVKTLVNLDKDNLLSNEIEKLASLTYGVRYNEKNLPKQVLYPLRDKGYITLERGTKENGRGAKPFSN